MLEKLKRSWSALKRGRPGSRFQKQYERQRKSPSSPVGRVLRVSAGLIILPVGLFLLPAPGPGFIVVALGAVLIAREFEFAVRLLDGLEVRACQVAGWSKRAWRRARTQRAGSR
jgi:uncharacterized protein (TIGR02611 family)